MNLYLQGAGLSTPNQKLSLLFLFSAQDLHVPGLVFFVRHLAGISHSGGYTHLRQDHELQEQVHTNKYTDKQKFFHGHSLSLLFPKNDHHSN